MASKYLVTVDYKVIDGQIFWRAITPDRDAFVASSPELAIGELFKCVNAASQFCLSSWHRLSLEELGEVVMKEQDARDILIVLKGKFKD